MPIIKFTRNLQRYYPSLKPMESSAVKLKLVLDDVNHAYPGILTYILDDQGRIRKHVQIFIKNEALVRRDTLDINVDQADEIYIMQALSGG